MTDGGELRRRKLAVTQHRLHAVQPEAPTAQLAQETRRCVITGPVAGSATDDLGARTTQKWGRGEEEEEQWPLPKVTGASRVVFGKQRAGPALSVAQKPVPGDPLNSGTPRTPGSSPQQTPRHAVAALSSRGFPGWNPPSHCARASLPVFMSPSPGSSPAARHNSHFTGQRSPA
ncbi:hypothetical protein HPB48_014999 [Haemaphysalis longicornis]|uniref:Uncharacterized protein n=1 Tax=Haemaphysalis longicornis TaxID=44386 RepID=A0A9J6FJH9_HAELO|nr:hypothetical protein HPB48_014999 [Haemaphysalis longicornis]